MREENVWGYIKRTIRESGMLGRLVAINVGVSLLLGVLYFIGALFQIEFIDSATGLKYQLGDMVAQLLAAPVDPSELLYRPWSLVTQLFTHGGILHLLFNMIMLYFSGRMFVHFFGEKRLLSVYIVGGIFAYLVHVLAFYTFPIYAGQGAGYVLGASGAIYAIFTAIVVHRPNLKVQPMFIPINIPIFVVFILFILGDFRGILSNDPADNTAHFAHIGGAIFGWISVININSQKNFMNRLERWLSKFKWPSFKRKPKMKVHESGSARNMTDDEYNAASKAHQDRIDAILDKISKKGYDGLTKEEKEILFNESKRKQ